MRLLAVVSKLTGVSTNVEASEITLNSPSIVKLSVSREEVSQLTRVNQDLVVTLRSGETITIKNFYVGKGDAQNQLVLEDSNGALWWVQDTDGAFHFQHLDDLTPLMTAEGSHDGGAIWPWSLAGLRSLAELASLQEVAVVAAAAAAGAIIMPETVMVAAATVMPETAMVTAAAVVAMAITARRQQQPPICQTCPSSPA